MIGAALMNQLLFVMANFVAQTPVPSKPVDVVNRAGVDRLVEPLIEGKWRSRLWSRSSIQRHAQSATAPSMARTAHRWQYHFEIGSLSKMFTSLILADMEQEGILNRTISAEISAP